MIGAATTIATIRFLTQAQIAEDAQIIAEKLRRQISAQYARGGPAAVRRAIDVRMATVGVPQGVVLLTDAAGRRIAGNVADWPPTVSLAHDHETIEIFRIGHDTPERMRVVASRLPDGERLLTGHVIERELRFARVMEDAMAVAMAMAVALAGLGAGLAARMIEARLGRTVATAEAVAAGDLARRVALDGSQDAFEALAVSVNAMLDRIAALMTELKVATDGLAHDLRSPLTRLRATLERALAASQDEGARVAVLRALDEGDRLLAMLDTALRITRAEAGLGREAFVEIDLATMIRDLVEMFEPLAEDRGMTVSATVPATLPIVAHREILGQALANLVDNALKYGDGQVEVTATRVAGGVAISVVDDGPGIPADRRPEAMKRFGRLDAARSESGAGLGLTLAAAVAHLHDGTLTLEDNRPGLIARLTLGG